MSASRLTRPIRTFDDEPVVVTPPVVPTMVVSSFKGGVGKTTLSTAVAQRLALAGLRVLFVTSDRQEDGRTRLGAKASDGQVPVMPFGSGSITVVSAHQTQLIELLYTPAGLARVGGEFAAAIVDTPPDAEFGRLAGVSLVVPVDGKEAAKNAIEMLRGAPDGSRVCLVGTLFQITMKQAERQALWDALSGGVRSKVAGLDIESYPEPLVSSLPVREAINQGKSVYDLPRVDHTSDLLQAIDTLVVWFLSRHYQAYSLPRLPPRSSSGVPYSPWRVL